MVQNSPEERLTSWSNLRKELDHIVDPLTHLSKYWANVPMVAYNHKIDPYNPKSWPTPWDIIVENKYDDFTIALMIGYSLRFTEKFKDSKIEVRTLVDSAKTRLYNLVYVDDSFVLNFDRNNAVSSSTIDESLYLENIFEVIFPR